MKIILTAVDNDGVQYPYETTTETLVADNKRLHAEVDRLHAIEARLVVENARLRKSDQDWTIANKLVAENVERLREENAALNEALDAVLENHEHCYDLIAVKAVRP